MTNPLRQTLIGLFVALVGAYGLSVAGFLALRLLVGERWFLVALMNNLLPLLLIPAPALLPLCLLLRRPRLALTQAPAALLFVITFGPLFLPGSPPPEDAPRLSLLTYNLYARQTDYAPLLAAIREADADIVVLQELTAGAAAFLAESLADEYPFQALHPDEWFAGQGILSRYPLLDDDYWRGFQGYQRVLVELGGQAIALYNLHAPIPLARASDGQSARPAEIADLLRRAAAESGPVILAGDFNLVETTDDYRHITARYADAYQQAGWGMGFTYPDFSLVDGRLGFLPPLARLDYVFHSAHFQAIEARVWPTSGGSDHYPLWVLLAAPIFSAP